MLINLILSLLLILFFLFTLFYKNYYYNFFYLIYTSSFFTYLLINNINNAQYYITIFIFILTIVIVYSNNLALIKVYNVKNSLLMLLVSLPIIYFIFFHKHTYTNTLMKFNYLDLVFVATICIIIFCNLLRTNIKGLK